MGYAPEQLVKALDCQPAEVQHWMTILGNKVGPNGLTRHQAASIAAVVRIRQRGNDTKRDLERFFAKLAFLTPERSDWMAVRLPRKGPQVIRGQMVADLREKRSFGGGVIFDPKEFMAGLKRR